MCFAQRWALEYRDSVGTLTIVGDTIRGHDWGFVLDPSDIPDTQDRPREVVLGNLRRVFEHYGWVLDHGATER